jgi:hypothetical protein
MKCFTTKMLSDSRQRFRKELFLVSVTKLYAFASRHARLTLSCSSRPAYAFG